jgi:hypothetical protein
MIQFPSFWYTNSRSWTYCRYDTVSLFLKRDTASCIHYDYVLDCVYQKEEKCIIPTVCLVSRLCVFERRNRHPNDKLHIWYTFLHFYNSYRKTIAFYFYLPKCSDYVGIKSIRKRETASCIHYAYVLDCVYQKEKKCIIPTVCLVSRLCVFERRNVHNSNIIGTGINWRVDGGKFTGMPSWNMYIIY